MAFLTTPTCLQLPPSAYTNLPDSTPLCRLIPPLPSEQHLHTFFNHGFETFTHTDPPLLPRPPAHLLTRLKIHPAHLSRINPRTVAHFIDNALTTLSHDRLHLLQVSWLDHRDTRFIDFLGEVGELVRLGKVRSLGVADFPTASLNRLVEAGINVSSNQVSFSMVDTRALVRLQDFCQTHRIGLLARSALVGGLLSERYLGVPEPRRKMNVVRAWGGWSLLQEVLYACKTVADRYGVTMANVAVRWALERGVSAVVVGGGAEYAESNVRAFEFELCEEDLGLLEGVASRGNDLFKILGDCGNEVQIRQGDGNL